MPWPFARKSTETRNVELPEKAGSFSRSRDADLRRNLALAQVLPAHPLTAATRFAFELFGELAKSPDSNNLFLSPASVMLCLGMAFELAAGETREEMAKALQMADADTFTVLRSAFRERKDVKLLTANLLCCSPHAHVDPEYAVRLRERYLAEVTALDFSRSDAIARINAWVNEKTQGMIGRIANDLSPLAALIGLNAIYFKGLWLKPFDRGFTREGTFTTAAGTKKQLPMMRLLDSYNYYEDERLQSITLPYSDEISMYVVLPAAGIDAREFQQSIGSDVWQSWMARFEPIKGTIEMPRFKASCDTDLKPALMALGMERVFDPRQAEFGGIHADQLPVWLDRVLHKAVIDVNEEGTEAAAATGFSAMFGSVPHTFRMIVDRPFFIAIYDARTGTILFMGWIGDPQ